MDRSHQLSFICPDLGNIARYAIVEDPVYRLLKRYLPGPYCFILLATREVPKLVQSKRKTVGIRVPNHPVTHALLAEFGRPIITTTAVVRGQDPHVDPKEIDTTFKGLALVLDGGTGGLLPTTVVDLSEGYPRIVREGAGPVDDFVS